MAMTYCMTSHCPLADGCLRFEDDAARNSLHRTYADFSEELIKAGNGEIHCPFFQSRDSEPA